MSGFVAAFKLHNSGRETIPDQISKHVEGYDDAINTSYDPVTRDGFPVYAMFVAFWEFYRKIPDFLGKGQPTYLACMEQGDPLGMLVMIRRGWFSQERQAGWGEGSVALPLAPKKPSMLSGKYFVGVDFKRVQEMYLNANYVRSFMQYLKEFTYKREGYDVMMNILKNPSDAFVQRIDAITRRITSELSTETEMFGKYFSQLQASDFDHMEHLVNESFLKMPESQWLQYNMFANFLILVKVLTAFSQKYTKYVHDKVNEPGTYRVFFITPFLNAFYTLDRFKR